jgi:hypothetical protein
MPESVPGKQGEIVAGGVPGACRDHEAHCTAESMPMMSIEWRLGLSKAG